MLNLPRRLFSAGLPSVPGRNLPSHPIKGTHLARSRQANTQVISKHLNRSTWYEASSLRISHELIPCMASPNYLLKLKLEADSSTVKPCTIVAALDVSGSMALSVGDSRDVEVSKFSRLDLVKHSINTIVQCLRPEDKLCLIPFSNNAEVQLPLMSMDADGKNKAQRVLQKMSASGGTNIWDGIHQAMDMIQPLADSNKFCLLLTDGEPNVEPPRGTQAEFMNYITQSLPSFPINTFGYGYGLNSELLVNLGEGGLFAHIPDHTMCNTVFINFLSNCLATAIPSVRMGLGNNSGIQLGLTGSQNLGSIQSGSPQHILIDAHISNRRDFNLELRFNYEGRTQTYTIDPHNSPETSFNSDSTFHLAKKLLLQIITKGMVDFNLQRTQDELNRLIEFINSDELRKLTKGEDSRLNALITNIKHPNTNDGQIYKAFSTQEWFERWGHHYLKYFVRSHQLSICSNFKDASLQFYGGTLFQEIRTEVEDIFSEIPIPQPSLSNTNFQGNFQQSFYQPSGPCFSGTGIVKMANGSTKLVRDLKKGDRIINSDGNISQLVCIIKTTIPNGVLDMVNFNGTRITPWHPIRVNQKWNFPYQLKEPMKTHCDFIYNFVLDAHHIITVDHIDGITLGHGITNDPVLAHPFFGTPRVIDNLKTHPGWSSGLIEIQTYAPTYDANGLITSFF